MSSIITLDVRRNFFVILGSFLFSISITGFLIPHQLLSGGVTGISILSNYIANIPVNLAIVIINIPIFIIGYKLVNKRFMIISLIGATSQVLFITWTSNVPMFVDDPLLSAIFGGVLGGLGAGIIFANRGSTGGIDIIAVIMRKYFSVDIGNTMLAINSVIIIILSLFFGVKLGMYTLISIYINALVIDKVQQGLDKKKALLVITEKPEESRLAIINQVKRGVTLLDGHGGYTKESKEVIFCLVNPFQLAKIREILLDIDSKAFITVLEASEVVGAGFKKREQ